METKVYYVAEGRYAVDIKYKGDTEFVPYALVPYEKIEAVLRRLNDGQA